MVFLDITLCCRKVLIAIALDDQRVQPYDTKKMFYNQKESVGLKSIKERHLLRFFFLGDGYIGR